PASQTWNGRPAVRWRLELRWNNATISPRRLNITARRWQWNPAATTVWYFIHNNLGYSYNQVGQFEEGERCCRSAIQINPCRPNGHKNLGIALAALGKYRDAAMSYITGTFHHAGDARSFKLLKELIQEHPELAFDFRKHL